MKLGEIADAIGARLQDTAAREMEIHGIDAPERADVHTITFLSDKKHLDRVQSSAAGAVIVPSGTAVDGKVCIEIDDPYTGYALTARLFEDTTPWYFDQAGQGSVVHPDAEIDESAVVGPGAVIGARVRIGAHTCIGAQCVIENDVWIGRQCRIDSGATIRYGCRIGNDVIIESNTVIGSNGFGNARRDGRFYRIPSFGNVVIEDDVWIGALVAIDRASFSSTRIGKGTRIDNMVHLAHNVEVGENTAMAAQTGISGSTKIGDRVIIAGQAGFVGHIHIGDDAFIGAKAGVSKNVESRSKITGYPARDFMTMRRIEAAQGELPSMLKEMKRMRTQLDSLQARMSNTHTRMEDHGSTKDD
jgi:UDP-3-O-[3-hydroxymyristoyl] glucosamine N-acyltransferase